MGEELLEWYNAYADPEGARELRLMVERIMAREKSWEDDDFAEGVMRWVAERIASDSLRYVAITDRVAAEPVFPAIDPSSEAFQA